MASRSTRQDVARAAGVSGATVSRVYNHPHLVDDATRGRVLSSAAALGFVPDKHASALRRGSSATVLFVEIEDDAAYRWPGQKAYSSLYGEIIRAVLHAAHSTPFQLQLVTLAPDQLPSLERYDFAGILGFDVTEQRWADALASFGKPVVCCHHGDQLKGVSTVTTDNRRGGLLQAAYLGGASAAYVTGLRDEVRSHRLRWEGFTSVLEPRRVFEAVGYAAGKRVADELEPMVRRREITAVACVNDLTALGIIDGLASFGITPEDVTVVGYDNLLAAGLLGHALPTVDARLPEVYARALSLLPSLHAEIHEQVEPMLVSLEIGPNLLEKN